MKIVLALDKFKGSLTAPAACDSVRRGLLAEWPAAQVIAKPMADGGEGTAAALRVALGGRWIYRPVTGPLPGQPVRARYLWNAGTRLAVVEMAQASGLVLLSPAQRNPLRTHTHGTGELLRDAIRRGARRIYLTVGGSATMDGGVGAATALGWQFLDVRGKNVGLGGGALERITTIVPPARRRWPVVEVLCDVDNPLCGTAGAARVFGPQKGATPAMVARLDAGLRHLARLVKAQLDKDIRNVRGAGAAGGLAAGALAFLDARLVPGVDAVAVACRLADDLDGADWVITGEGCFDEQSLHGKVVAGVLKLARQRSVPVSVLAGKVKLSKKRWRRAGVTSAVAIQSPGMSTAVAMRRADELLFGAARRMAPSLQSSPKHSAKRVCRRRSRIV